MSEATLSSDEPRQERAEIRKIGNGDCTSPGQSYIIFNTVYASIVTIARWCTDQSLRCMSVGKLHALVLRLVGHHMRFIKFSITYLYLRR